MGRAPCCAKVGLKKGRWTGEEDEKLVAYIKANGEGSWRSLPKNAGLLRCGKSCRLRWINYLRDDLKRGNISSEEEETIMKLHSSLGNKWSLIASHLPGRTDNEIKNYWNSHLSRKINNNTKTDAGDNEAAAEEEEKNKSAKKTATKNGSKSKPKKKSSKKKKPAEKVMIESPTDSSTSSSAQSEGEAESMVLDPDPHQTSSNSNSSSSTDLEAEPQDLHVVETSFWSSNDALELNYDDLFGSSTDEDSGTLSTIEERESGSTLIEEREPGRIARSNEENESGSVAVCQNTSEEREGGFSVSNEQERERNGDPNPNPSGAVDVKEAEGGGGGSEVKVTLMEEEALSKEMEGTLQELDMEGINDVWTWLCDNTENVELGIQGFGDSTFDYDQTQMDSIASWLLSDGF